MTVAPPSVFPLDPVGLDTRLDALAGILHACVHDGASVSFVLPFAPDEARAFWSDKVRPGVVAGSTVLLVASVDGVIAGTVQLDCATPPNQRHRADVAKLLVLPAYRRRGVARALMRTLERHARERQRRLLTLDTLSGSAAEPLYRSLGFMSVGTIPGYARDPAVDRFDGTTLMYKMLE